MGLKGIFSNSFETVDHGSNKDLLTHYYQADYEKVKNTIIDISKGMRFKVSNINDDFHEMLILMPRGELIVTLFNQTPSVTSVDFKVTTYKMLPNGKGKKIIERLYKYLDKNLTFKGVSLYK